MISDYRLLYGNQVALLASARSVIAQFISNAQANKDTAHSRGMVCIAAKFAAALRIAWANWIASFKSCLDHLVSLAAFADGELVGFITDGQCV